MSLGPVWVQFEHNLLEIRASAGLHHSSQKAVLPVGFSDIANRNKKSEPQCGPDSLFGGAYLPWQQLSQPPLAQQSLHLSQQLVQQPAFAESSGVCENAVTVRTTATERTAMRRFIKISLTLNLR